MSTVRSTRVPLAKVKDDLSRYLRAAAKEEIVITRHGRPAGVLIGFATEDDWLDYRLENHPEFVTRIAAARAALRAGEGMLLERVPDRGRSHHPSSLPRVNESTARAARGGDRPMHRFHTILVSGKKRPYTSWTFMIIPPDLAMNWGPGQKAVRGTISGYAFRGTASTGEGALRVPIPRDLREKAGLCRGDTVEVALELDAAPRRIHVPDELRAVFKDDPDVAALYRKLPPAHRRAWATYVAEAKRPETRMRRARRSPDGIRARDFPG